MGQTMFDVRSLEAKNRVYEFEFQRMNTLGLFNVRKAHVQICLLSNLVKKALLSSKFDIRLFEAKNRMFKFDDQ